MRLNTFKREERLKSKKHLGRLFEEGRSFSVFPLRVIWVKVDPPQNPFPVQVAFSVPKRKFPKAVQRNRIKRQLREAYRLNKLTFYEKLGRDHQLAIMILYLSKEQIPMSEMNVLMVKLMKRLVKNVHKSTRKPTPNKK